MLQCYVQVSSLPLPSGSWGLRSGLQALWQAEPPLRCCLLTKKSIIQLIFFMGFTYLVSLQIEPVECVFSLGYIVKFKKINMTFFLLPKVLFNSLFYGIYCLPASLLVLQKV